MFDSGPRCIETGCYRRQEPDSDYCYDHELYREESSTAVSYTHLIFRHTFASRFCENEKNIKVIQEVMGHADVSTTMNIYAEANPDVTKSVIEKLSKNMDIF